MTTDKLEFLVIENDSGRYENLRHAIIMHSMKKNADVEIKWISDENQIDSIKDYAQQLHIALIDGENSAPAIKAGELLLEKNSDAFIVFFGNSDSDLKSYFSSRPVAFFDYENELDSLNVLLEKLHEKIAENKKMFTWTNKNIRIFVPYRYISHIQSCKGSLELYTTDSRCHRFIGKLDIVEERIEDENFLRIHKSTLVNKNHVQFMDRSNKCLIMSDGTKVYISKAYYKAVTAAFDEK